MDRDRPYLSLVPEWRQDQDEPLAETRIFTLRQLRAASPQAPGRPGRFVYLDSPDWVNVVALTPPGEVVLIEQYRHGLGRVTLEIPGGMVDAGEEPLAAGVRELREETGFAGGAAEVVGKVSPNPAIQNNWCHTVVVREAEAVARQALEAHEEIALRLEPVERVPDLIREGWIHHALVVAAFQHYWLSES